MPILVKIGQGILAWRRVEFCPFQLLCVVAIAHFTVRVND